MQGILFAVLAVVAAGPAAALPTSGHATLDEVRLAVTDLRPTDEHPARVGVATEGYAYTQSAAAGSGGTVAVHHDRGLAWLADSAAELPGADGARTSASTHGRTLQAEVAAPWRLNSDLNARAASAAWFWLSPYTRLTLSARGSLRWRGDSPLDGLPAVELRLQLHAGATTVADTLSSAARPGGSTARMLSVSFVNDSERPVKVQAFVYAQAGIPGTPPPLRPLPVAARRPLPP